MKLETISYQTTQPLDCPTRRRFVPLRSSGLNTFRPHNYQTTELSNYPTNRIIVPNIFLKSRRITRGTPAKRVLLPIPNLLSSLLFHPLPTIHTSLFTTHHSLFSIYHDPFSLYPTFEPRFECLFYERKPFEPRFEPPTARGKGKPAFPSSNIKCEIKNRKSEIVNRKVIGL
jgi:hypothetical protein